MQRQVSMQFSRSVQIHGPKRTSMQISHCAPPTGRADLTGGDGRGVTRGTGVKVAAVVVSAVAVVGCAMMIEDTVLCGREVGVVGVLGVLGAVVAEGVVSRSSGHLTVVNLGAVYASAVVVVSAHVVVSGGTVVVASVITWRVVGVGACVDGVAGDVTGSVIVVCGSGVVASVSLIITAIGVVVGVVGGRVWTMVCAMSPRIFSTRSTSFCNGGSTGT